MGSPRGAAHRSLPWPGSPSSKDSFLGCGKKGVGVHRQSLETWLCAFSQRSIARHDTFPLPARVILALPIMPKPEAFSRVLIDQALKDSGWDPTPLRYF